MDAKNRARPAKVYQDFAPPSELVSEEDCDTLLVYLPGFTKDQIRVRLTNAGNLIISGEQPVGDNTWRRFEKTFPISTNCEVNKINAKFEDFILYITQPKLITSEKKQDQEKPQSTSASESQNPVDEQKPSNNVEQEEPNHKPASVTDPDGHKNGTNNKSAKNAENVPEKAQEKENEQETGDGKSTESSDLKNVAEKAAKTRENVDAKSVSETTLTDRQKNGTEEDGKSKEDSNQKQERDLNSLVVAATKLKMTKKVMNLVLAILLAIAIGLYVKNSVDSWKKAQN